MRFAIHHDGQGKECTCVDLRLQLAKHAAQPTEWSDETGDFEDVPAITTLSEIDLRTNPAVLQRLGLEQVAMHDDAGGAQ